MARIHDFRVLDEAAETTAVSSDDVHAARDAANRFLMEYRFGLREVETKIAILRDEFEHMHDYNPIEHVSSRIKTPESILAKIERKGIAFDFDAVREHITDIAGLRVTCSFVPDAYRLFELLTKQDDISVRTVKDYIAEPKPSGYKSLHAVIDVPIFLSTGATMATVEVQFRSIAMDFWASLEHKIYYKYNQAVPPSLLDELHDAARIAGELDERMQRLHRELHGAPTQPHPSSSTD